MPLATSEIRALKLGLSPLRILLPEREIRRRGIGSEGVILNVRRQYIGSPISPHDTRCVLNFFRTYPAVPLSRFSLTQLFLFFFRTYPAVLSRFAIITYPVVALFFYALTLLCPYFTF